MNDSGHEPLPVPSTSSEHNGAPSQGAVFSILLFASLKDAAGCDKIAVRVALDAVRIAPDEASAATPSQLHLPTEGVLVSDLLRCCGEQHPTLKRWLPYVKVAVNCEYADLSDSVLPTDEIALLPPVSGGAIR